VSNQTFATEVIPVWAIVLAIIFFVFCLLGLLFLLVKERRVHGAVQVGVQGPGFSYATYSCLQRDGCLPHLHYGRPNPGSVAQLPA
jgi:hypothetical protein